MYSLFWDSLGVRGPFPHGMAGFVRLRLRWAGHAVPNVQRERRRRSTEDAARLRREGWRMKDNPLDLSPEIAFGFVEAMKDYFAEEDQNKRDAIAARQLSVLQEYQNSRDGKLRLSDVKAMFEKFRKIMKN
jgi:hypothetical protein